MSDVRVHVDRVRPTCPFCKDEVASGHVWVCPGCAASHHGACHDEHGACASCALTEPREGVSAATKGDAPADDPGGLAPRRRELERLGFQVVRETADELVAIHSQWRHGSLATPLPHAVFVRRVAHLTLADLKADLEALRGDPLSSCYTVPVYLAERVDPQARRFVERGRAVAHLMSAARFFPVIHDAETGAGTFFARSRPLGFQSFPGLRLLARRLLFPWVTPEATREPAVTLWTLMILAGVVAIVTLGVLLQNTPR